MGVSAALFMAQFLCVTTRKTFAVIVVLEPLILSLLYILTL